ncbi:type 2 periplasmic-binding domain-containing protein [Leucobacter salsicius]|uniref:hypothetical protein n=1 Tax=Leucobacter salsicius TaxID=664638 RepID=UPI0003678138|nr:hypothetical protein [Leucobacter salsicius]
MAVAKTNLEAKYPGLEIQDGALAVATYDELTQAIVGDIAVGKRPDVIMSGLGQLRFWVDTYQPSPIDPQALAETYRTEFLAPGTVDGTSYLAPAQISAPVLLVNQSMLDEAQAGSASDIKTYDDWLAAATAVSNHTKSPSVTVATTGLADWYAQSFVQGAGAKLVDENGMPAFAGADGSSALKIWSELANAEVDSGITDDAQGMAAFGAQESAFFMYTTSAISAVQEAVGGRFEWVPIPVPTLDGETHAQPAGGNGWLVLSQDSCQAAYSNELVGELLSTEAVLAASGTEWSYIPVDESAKEQLLASDAATPQMKYAWDYTGDLTEWGGFAGSNITKVNDVFRTMAQKLQAGKSAQDAIDDAAAAVESLVKE